jgi:FdhD protein
MRKPDPEQSNADILSAGSVPAIIQSYASGKWEQVSGAVPHETGLTIFLDGEELVTVMCTPVKLAPMVLGFLYLEDIIKGREDVAVLRVCEEDSTADVRLKVPGFETPARRTLSSGCGRPTTFAPQSREVVSSMVVTAQEVLSLMSQLNEKAQLYRFSGGVHTSGLGRDGKLAVVAEDIGRHNTIDKVMGECLLTGMPTGDGILLTTGRISSEMLSKAARMEVPVVVSRSSPTSKAVTLAGELKITLIGYVRGSRMQVYTHPERLREPANC